MHSSTLPSTAPVECETREQLIWQLKVDGCQKNSSSHEQLSKLEAAKVVAKGMREQFSTQAVPELLKLKRSWQAHLSVVYSSGPMACSIAEQLITQIFGTVSK
jgi:hypothetical protein